MSKNEHNVIKHQISSLNISRLEKVDSLIAGYFSDIEKKILADSLYISNDTEKFAIYLKGEPLVKNGIIFDENGKRIFPANGKSLSEKERIFIEKTKMFREENIVSQQTFKQIDQQAPRQQAQQYQQQQSDQYQQSEKQQSTQRESLSKSIFGNSRTASRKVPYAASHEKKKPVKYGWYTWFSGIEQNHIFWWKNNGKTFGVELFHARLISDIIIMLPTASGTIDSQLSMKRKPLQLSSSKPGPSRKDALIKLIDSNNALIYQWGAYIPTEQEKHAAVLSLSKPLGSWKLEYYADKKSLNSIFNLFNILSTLIAIGAILSGLAYYLYREHRREIILGKQRVNFVSQVSHELKTPLTNIRMYAELLETQLLDEQLIEEQLLEEGYEEEQQSKDGKIGGDYDADPKYIKHIKIISSESQRLSRLIANILNFSKSTKSGLNVHKTQGEIDVVISSVISKFEPLLAEKDFEFDIQLNARESVLFDQDALEQILNNLLSNVEKYGASGKFLHIESVQHDDFTTITVQDKGPGIPASEQAKVFEPFYRISSKLTDGVSGTGIGLSIAKDLAILHGGCLELVPFESGAHFKLKIHTPTKT